MFLFTVPHGNRGERKNMKQFEFQPLGVELEDEISVCFEQYFKADKSSFKLTVGTPADIKAGTDAYIYGIPCDFTCFFEGKDFMDVLPGEVKLYDTDPRDAAMIMAIVANKLNKPLNELRFVSIKEVK